jgi:thioester reductase-like protein
MTLFLTGSTGYLGSYLVADVLRHFQTPLALLVRASSLEEAKKAFMDFPPTPFDF